MIHSILKTTQYSIALVGVCLSANAVSQAKRPNILVIMGDDISRNSMGVYGSKYIKTPNFDRIANEGGKG